MSRGAGVVMRVSCHRAVAGRVDRVPCAIGQSGRGGLWPLLVEAKPLTFKVEGPFDMKVAKGPGGKVVRAEEGREFFHRHRALARRRGCYVFAVRGGGKEGGSYTPWYVGRATKSFVQECFADHKLSKYNECLIQYRKGRPVLFFIVAPPSKGKPPGNLIGKLETYLIQTAAAHNPEILNIKGTRKPRWTIDHVTQVRKGKTPKAAQAFKRTMGLERPV